MNVTVKHLHSVFTIQDFLYMGRPCIILPISIFYIGQDSFNNKHRRIDSHLHSMCVIETWSRYLLTVYDSICVAETVWFVYYKFVWCMIISLNAASSNLAIYYLFTLHIYLQRYFISLLISNYHGTWRPNLLFLTRFFETKPWLIDWQYQQWFMVVSVGIWLKWCRSVVRCVYYK